MNDDLTGSLWKLNDTVAHTGIFEGPRLTVMVLEYIPIERRCRLMRVSQHKGTHLGTYVDMHVSGLLGDTQGVCLEELKEFFQRIC